MAFGSIGDKDLSVPKGARLQGVIVKQQLKIEGFIIYRFTDRYDEANSALAQWVKEVGWCTKDPSCMI